MKNSVSLKEYCYGNVIIVSVKYFSIYCIWI